MTRHNNERLKPFSAMSFKVFSTRVSEERGHTLPRLVVKDGYILVGAAGGDERARRIQLDLQAKGHDAAVKRGQTVKLLPVGSKVKRRGQRARPHFQQSPFVAGRALQALFQLPGLHVVHPDVPVLAGDGHVRLGRVQVHVVQRGLLHHMVAPGEQQALHRLGSGGRHAVNNALRCVGAAGSNGPNCALTCSAAWK